MRPLWETTYADLHAKSFGNAGKEVLDLIPLLPARAKVLDLGCGDGRNAIPLARAGFTVTAVDISEAGIRKLDMLAARDGLTIHSSVGDMTRFEFPEEYDLIISHGCLHFVKPSQWEEMIERFKAHTAPSGFNVITVFTDAIPAPPDLAPLCVGLFREGELYERYSEWETILKKSYTFEDEHAGGIRHTHAANKLVVRNCRMG
ncbi:methyltransferase domain-containing protein [Desulfoluna butyratoxydans]|uniref:S-adenosyl-l-methionine-dependent methyltransferase n=1 Tax=Desulfoluna butyratoxydans TaxID=231438 RepID=A0A4U8YQ69_9BACT|nr:methyltransferase domain-containing protein [Desulfoluna butyratoxydans]VFQ45399.1 s-adenosyl-l-methionine-dependent methyltransferase [Desulfoluna butyratoxydans]